jgi:hypothetical protein
MRKVFLLLTVFISLNCHSQNCSTLPNKFTSYNQAISIVENSRFKIDETINTSKSGWILNAHYYSCDGKTGFFIIKMKRKEYIHAGMPVSVWQQFKRANSFGSFYDYYIKGRYRLYLN